jgi:hypothetical protein
VSRELIFWHSITCRKRHKKCDEVLPRCGSCILSDRTCIWPHSRPENRGETPRPKISELVEIAPSHSEISSFRPLTPHDEQTIFPPSDHSLATAYSPANTISSDLLTADLASVRWLDLLAADAVQANRGFSRATSPVGDTPSRIFGELLAAQPITEDSVTQGESARLDGLEARSWQLEQDIVLKDFETAIFRNFVDRVALWVSSYLLHNAPCTDNTLVDGSV